MASPAYNPNNNNSLDPYKAYPSSSNSNNNSNDPFSYIQLAEIPNDPFVRDYWNYVLSLYKDPTINISESIDPFYSVDPKELIRLEKIREIFLKNVKVLDKLNLAPYVLKFREYIDQNLYYGLALIDKGDSLQYEWLGILTEEDKKKVKKYIFRLCCKRGNSKFIRKIKNEIKIRERLLSKLNSKKSGYTNALFITLTVWDKKYIHAIIKDSQYIKLIKRKKNDIKDPFIIYNPLKAWLQIKPIISDYIHNLGTDLKRYKVKIIDYFGSLGINQNLFPHAHLIVILDKPIPIVKDKKGKYRLSKNSMIKKRLFEWNLGLVDVQGIPNKGLAEKYLTKYILKQIEKNENEPDILNTLNDQDKEEIEKAKKSGKYIELFYNGKPIYVHRTLVLLTILWLLRLHTLIKKRLDKELGELTSCYKDIFEENYIPYNENYRLIYIGLIQIRYISQFYTEYKYLFDSFIIDNDNLILGNSEVILKYHGSIDLDHLFLPKNHKKRFAKENKENVEVSGSSL
jgi:hypothetical protein